VINGNALVGVKDLLTMTDTAQDIGIARIGMGISAQDGIVQIGLRVPMIIKSTIAQETGIV
jgi:hypothetical protein